MSDESDKDKKVVGLKPNLRTIYSLININKL